jgi:hypothetical protein
MHSAAMLLPLLQTHAPLAVHLHWYILGSFSAPKVAIHGTGRLGPAMDPHLNLRLISLPTAQATKMHIQIREKVKVRLLKNKLFLQALHWSNLASNALTASITTRDRIRGHRYTLLFHKGYPSIPDFIRSEREGRDDISGNQNLPNDQRLVTRVRVARLTGNAAQIQWQLRQLRSSLTSACLGTLSRTS